MTDTELQPTVPIATTEPGCPACGSKMSVDQRYCLMCGERRGSTRVPFNREQIERPAPVAAPAPASPVAARATASHAWLTAVGVLILAMGVGVLIGRAGNREATVAAPQPVQVTVPTGGAAVASPTPDATAKGKDAGKKGKKGKAAGEEVAPTSQAELQELENLSPDEYQKKSKALPDKVGTAGTPVPKDNKPAGGGSETEEIG